MQWLFPRSDLGQDSGLHDAGVETFKGNYYRHLAREVIQNSLDARVDFTEPVVVKFDACSIARERIPEITGLEDTFCRCRDYWLSDVKATTFFDKAIAIVGSAAITILRASDYNTTGVVGSDVDRTKNWFSLIRSSGSSSKYRGEGGSYGIGKNAPFAASYLRTVLYSTFTSDANHAFQGVAKLVTHELAGGGKALPVGYLGGPQGQSIRSTTEIPKLFRRNECGSDIVILGFNAEPTWEEELELSVLEYFWPAIHFGDLEVQIGDRTLTSANLSSRMEARSAAEGFTAHQYYAAFISPSSDFQDTLRSLREVTLHIRIGETELPKRVAMVRKLGMVIYHKQFRSALPFCGVFMCRNDHGNAVLRDMEPPRHDTWDPDFPEKGANRRIEKEFGDYIRACIKQLTIKDDVKVIPIPELSRFLPDDDEAPEEPFGLPPTATEPPPEGFPGAPAAPKPRAPLPVEKMSHRKPMQPDSHSPQAEAPEETETASSESGGTTGGRAGEAANNVDGGIGSGGGEGPGSSTLTAGRHGEGSQSKPTIPIRARAYPKDSTTDTYAIAIHPVYGGERNTIISLFAVGDDAKEPVRIRAARRPDGTEVPVESLGRLGPLKFPQTGSVNLEIQLAEPRRVSMEVSAHEA